MAFKERLRSVRSARSMTVVQLANAAGVAESSIRNWEHGRYTPRPEQTVKLAAALGVEEGDLTGNHQRTPPPPAFSAQNDPLLGEVFERCGAMAEQFTLIGRLLKDLDGPMLTVKLFEAHRAFIAFTAVLMTVGGHG